jgi:hypothetical protein
MGTTVSVWYRQNVGIRPTVVLPPDRQPAAEIMIATVAKKIVLPVSDRQGAYTRSSDDRRGSSPVEFVFVFDFT